MKTTITYFFINWKKKENQKQPHTRGVSQNLMLSTDTSAALLLDTAK